MYFSHEKSDNANKAFEKLVDYLARRDHSLKELKEKLSRRFTQDAIKVAIEEAKNHNYLADPNDLANRVARQLNDKNKGFLYIQNYLREKGLPPVDRDEHIEIEKAEYCLQSKLTQYQSLTYEVRPKLERHLKNRGFDLETIKTVIQQLKFSSSEEEQ